MHTIPNPDPPPPDLRSALHYFGWLAGRHRAMVGLAALLGILCTVAQGLVPEVLGRAVDAGLLARDRAALFAWVCSVLIFGVIQAITGMLRDRCSARGRFGATYLTMQYVVRQAGRLGASLAHRVSAGEVVSIGAGDITRIGLALESTARGSGAVASSVLVAGFMLATSWRLGLLVLIAVPMMAWILARLMQSLHARQKHLRDEQAAMTGLSVDIVDGLRVLRGIGGEAIFAARYAERSQRVRRLSVHVATVEAWVASAQIWLPGLLITAIVWLGVGYVDAGEISGGVLVSFYGFSVFLAEQLRRIATMTDQLTRALVASRRVVDFLSLEPRPEVSEPVALDSAAPASLVDPDSRITVPPDCFLGVVCTAQADAEDLACRLAWYAEADTAVTYGGVALSQLPRAELRSKILLVNATSKLFSGTLRAELDPHRRTEAHEDELWRAIDGVSARDIVDSLSDGLDTKTVGAGREFSGGQRQRLMLARALLANPAVLILVEPTNAVDAHTEDRVAERLKAYRQGRATVVFTSSPIVLDHADAVAFVADGAVAAISTHQTLMDDPRYQAIVARELVDL